MDNTIAKPIVTPMTFDSDICVIGGGLNGCAMAIALAKHGLRVSLIDSLDKAQMMQEGYDGRSYALALASQRLLQAIDTWDALHERAQPMLDIKVSDGKARVGPGPFGLHFEQTALEEGPMGFMVEDRHLRPALIKRIESMDKINHLTPQTVVAQQANDTSARVTLASGAEIRAQLLIGSDGRKSATAQRAGISRDLTDYGQTAVVATIAHEKPHNGVAHQFFMPAGPLAILPLTGNRSSIVWAETPERAAILCKLDEPTFIQELRPAFGDFLGSLTLAGPRFSYPIIRTLTERITHTRLALIGDAAHGVHPIAGQGLNLGLRDVGALAEVVIMSKRRGEDIGSKAVLERFARWRRFDISTLAMATHGVNALFSNDHPILRLGRGFGMALINAIGPAKRQFIREAAGLTGDVPRLLQGKTL